MSHISNIPRLYVCPRANLAEKLNEKPDSDQQCGGNECYAGEYAEQTNKVRIRS